MKVVVASLLLACLSPLSLLADDLPCASKIFVGLDCQYSFPVWVWEEGWWPWRPRWIEWKEEEQQQLVKGSFWAVHTPDRTILITATHVLGLNLDLREIDGHKVDQKTWSPDQKTLRLNRVERKVLLGTLSFQPAEVGSVERLNDAAFLTAKDSGISKTIKPLILSDTAPKIGEDVQVWGYPGTAYQQHESASVTQVQDNGFFILNRAVDEGYSGGVVVNSAGNAYGIITNTDQNKQTTVLRITPEMLQAIDWHPAAEMLNHSF